MTDPALKIKTTEIFSRETMMAFTSKCKDIRIKRLCIAGENKSHRICCLALTSSGQQHTPLFPVYNHLN